MSKIVYISLFFFRWRLINAHTWISCTNTIVHNFGEIFGPNYIPANTSCYGFARAYPEPDFFAQTNSEPGLFSDQGRQTYVWSNAWDTEGRTISKRQITTTNIPSYFPKAPMARARPGDIIRIQIVDPNNHSGPNDAGWSRIFWGGGVRKTLTQESQLTDDKIIVYQSWQRSFPHRTVNETYFDYGYGYIDLPLVDNKGRKLKEGIHSFTYTWGDDLATEKLIGQNRAARIGFVNVFEVFVDSKADPVKLLPWPLSSENKLLKPINPVFGNTNYNNDTGTRLSDILAGNFGGIPQWKWIGFSADKNFGYIIPQSSSTESSKTVYSLPGSIIFDGNTNVNNTPNYITSQYKWGQFGGSFIGNNNE